MRKLTLFFAVLILFLLVPASITWAQVTKTLNGTVRYESGMSKSELSTPNGNVKITLPQSMSGKMINGVVSTEPAGKTEKEKNRNQKELLKYVLMLDGQKIPLSATPTAFDWLTHQDRNIRTPMELLNVSGAKVAELSLPPVLPAPAIDPGHAPHLTTPSNLLVKGDALNIYTDQQFSPGEKFTLTDSKGQQFTMSPVCLSSQQAVMNMPEAASPGYCTVSNVYMGVDQITPVNFNLIDISLTSPNTNLRPGEQSFVQVLCKGSAGNLFTHISGIKNDYDNTDYSIDLRNLNPNIVTMDGGNLQRVSPGFTSADEINGIQDKLTEGLTIKRNITGNIVGTFSVSATLHEDYNTSNDPFRPQLNVLKTPEEFNAWANALKKDLGEYAAMQNKDESLSDPLQKDFIQSSIKANAQRAIDNMPVCTSPEQLDESKAVAYSLLQPLQVPKGAAISWLSSYEATKAAVTAIDYTLAGNTDLIDYDVLKNGTEFMNRVGGQLKDASLQTQCSNVQQLIDDIQTSAETKENLQDLRNKMETLISAANTKMGPHAYSYFKQVYNDIVLASYQLPSLASPGKPHPVNDLIGYLDPQRKILVAAPGNDQKVLNEYGAVRLADGHYRVQTVTAYHSPVNLVVSLLHLPQFEIFQMSKKVLDSLMKLKATVDSLNEAAVKDSTKKGSLVWFELDSSNATWSRIFLDSKCVEIRAAIKSDCLKDNRRSKLVFNDKDELVWKYASMRINYPAVKQCLRAKMGQCQEILTYIRKITLYDGLNCNFEVSSHTEGLQFVCK